MITTSGLCSLARSHSWATASNSCSRMESPSGAVPGEIRQQHAEGGATRAGPVQHLLPAVLGDQVAQDADHGRVRQTLAAQRHALAADQLGLTVGQRPEQVLGEGLDDRGLAGAGVAADDHEAAAVADHLVEQGAQPSPLVGPSDHVLGPVATRRSACSAHRLHRAIHRYTLAAVTECLAEAVRVVRVAGCRSH